MVIWKDVGLVSHYFKISFVSSMEFDQFSCLEFFCLVFNVLTLSKLLNNSFKHINQSLSFIVFLVKYLGDISWWLIWSHLTSEPDAQLVLGFLSFHSCPTDYFHLLPEWNPLFSWISHFSVYRFISLFWWNIILWLPEK